MEDVWDGNGQIRTQAVYMSIPDLALRELGRGMLCS